MITFWNHLNPFISNYSVLSGRSPRPGRPYFHNFYQFTQLYQDLYDLTNNLTMMLSHMAVPLTLPTTYMCSNLNTNRMSFPSCILHAFSCYLYKLINLFYSFSMIYLLNLYIMLSPRAVTLIWPTACSTAWATPICLRPKTTWLMWRSWYPNSSICQSSWTMQTTTILVRLSWICLVCQGWAGRGLSFVWNVTHQFSKNRHTILKNIGILF